jgi:hypothetical protein
MRRISPTFGTALFLLLPAAILSIPARSAPEAAQKISSNLAPSYTQMNDPKVQLAAMDKRVADLEAKLAALQKQVAQGAAHTHSYHAPQCAEFVSLLNLQAAINNPNAHAGMGVCLIRPLVGGTPTSQTSAPGK